MAVSSASTLFKKQEGVLAVAKDKGSISWTPAQPGATPVLALEVVKITNLQQTPPDKPKAILKIVYTEPGQTEPVSYAFQFTSKSDARGEMSVIRDVLSDAMAKAKQSALAQTTAGGQSAAMTIAAAISGGKGSTWEDDEKLITDVRLQQALLRDNAELQKTYMETKNQKPESLSLTQFTKQFWASRVHLLRAHALAQAQTKGLYNVFSVVKFTGEGSNRQLNLTSEHIKAIFEQYPIMRIVYDEVVPKKIKDEREFWSRFFQSQLYSTLRGLKVDRRAEARDAIMDQYLDHPELTGLRPTPSELHIPKFIDLEGNEENHSQRKGNRPDVENRQSSLEKGPIIRRLNAISERLMAAVKPSDVDASAPIGVDESEYEQLRLRDLAAREEQQRIALNIRDQSHLFSDNRATTEDAEVARIRALDPFKAIQKVSHRLDDAFSKPGNAPTVEIEEEDEYMDEEELRKSKAESGSTLANSHIFELIKAHRDQSSEAANLNNNPKSYGGLSEEVYERLVLTHATTLEFLRQFWSAFLSGDPSRTAEIASLVESLNRALDRINAIATDAQAEREDKIRTYEGQAAQIFKQTGKRKKVDRAGVGGGEKVVKQLLGPCTRALSIAVDKYRTVYEQQLKEVQSQQGED